MDTIQHNPALSAFSPVQAKVILALAQGQTITQAAKSAEIHRSTIHEWLKNDSAFRDAVAKSRQEYIQTLKDQMTELSALALNTLRALLEDPNTPASVRLRAALAILERPCHPDPVWSLPASVHTPEDDKFRQNYAELEADMKIARLQEALRAERRQNAANPEPNVPEVSRNAPCPCGSGHKYKRCHGAAA
jgi:uncharacterized protein (UPF0147 family)